MQTPDYAYHYRRWHPDTREHLEGMSRYSGTLLKGALPAAKDAPILEVGCGGGFALHYLKEAGFTVVEGVDIDMGQVEACVKKGLPARLVDDTIAFLNARSDQYELILAFDVIEHLPRDAQLMLITSVCRALKAGGRFVCTVPNANSIIAGRYRYIDFTHHTSFTEASLDHLLHSGGFSEIEIGDVEAFGRPSHRRWWYKEYRRWWMRWAFRKVRRLQLIAELGFEEGEHIPLTPNIRALARR